MVHTQALLCSINNFAPAVVSNRPHVGWGKVLSKPNQTNADTGRTYTGTREYWSIEKTRQVRSKSSNRGSIRIEYTVSCAKRYD
jgi:hypothetical protein